MNLLFLSELFYPHGGGAELATFLYAKSLSASGINVTVVTNKFAGESDVSKDGTFIIYRLPMFRGIGTIKYSILKRFDILLSNFVKRLIKWADVVYVPRFWYFAIPMAKLYGKPVIVHLHDYLPICSLSTAYDIYSARFCLKRSFVCSPRCIYALEKTLDRGFVGILSSIALNSTVGPFFGKFVESSDAIICVSMFQRDILIETKPILRSNISVIYNPFLTSSELNIKKSDDFGYFGGPSFLKGFHTLYSAARNITQTGRRAIKIHCTKFSRSKLRFAESLSKLGFILYEKLNSDAYQRIYQQVGTVVVPSIWHEPWPYAVVEALVSGRLVIASKVGGIPEQVDGCKGAFMFESGNYRRLADLMKFVTELSKEEVVNMSCTNRENFLRKFSNESSIKKFIKICESFI